MYPDRVFLKALVIMLVRGGSTVDGLLAILPDTVRCVLGDTHYQDPALHAHCAAAGRCLVATRRGPSPHRDDGLEVRRGFHTLRSLAIETFNGQFKTIFELRAQVPARGAVALSEIRTSLSLSCDSL